MSASERPVALSGRPLPALVQLRLLSLRHRRWVELGVLVLLLTAISAPLFVPHILHGGFIGDAWSTRAWYRLYPHGRFFATVGHFLELPSMSTRPLNAVYRVVLNDAFGGEMGAWFAWQAASCLVMSLLVYLLLRRLGFGPLDAGAIAVLLLLFPAADSLKFWDPVIHASLAIALAAGGFLVALAAFAASGARRALLHGSSLLLFAASLLLYEVALPVMLASLFLYRLRVPWRAALQRWALDCAVLVPIALTVTRSASSAAQRQSASGALAHAELMLERAPKLLAQVLLPFGGAGWYAVAAIALLALVSLLLARRPGVGELARARLRRWLGVLAAGLLVVVLGYAIYIPGIDYYEPTAPGIADRVNAVAAIGWVLVLYASIALAVTLAVSLRRGPAWLRPASTALLAALLAASWLPKIAGDANDYTRAFREGQRTLAIVRAAVPQPRAGTTIWTFGQPVEIAPGVPVFANTWDMTDSVALMYGDRSLRSYVGFPGTVFECRANAIVPGGNQDYPPAAPPEASEFASGYGVTYFVDTVSGQFELIRSRAQCVRATASFPRSPLLPAG